MAKQCLPIDFETIESVINRCMSKKVAPIALVGKQSLSAIKESPLSEISTKQGKNSRVNYLTRKQVCETLHISYPTLHRLINNGILKCLKIGRRSLFDLSAVQAAIINRNTDSYGHQ